MRIAIVGLMVGLAACAPRYATTAADHEHYACVSYGFDPASPEYSQCRLQLAQQRQATGTAMMQQGLGIMMQARQRPLLFAPQPAGPRSCTLIRQGAFTNVYCP